MTDAAMSGPSPGGVATIAGRPVARIGYGAMQLGHRPGAPVAPPTAVAVLRRARALGVNHIDTAAFYGDGTANARIRAALHPYEDDLILATKVGARFDDVAGALVMAQRPHELRAEVEKNLRQLDTDRLPVVYLRRGDTAPGLIARGDQIVDIDSQLEELARLRDEGKIGAVGLSQVSSEQLRRALPFGIAGVQNVYNLLDRRHEDELLLCQQHDIAWVPYFPLGSAFPAVPKVTDAPTVKAVAAHLGTTAPQVGLAWLLAHAPNLLLIPGTASIAHLEENLAAGDITLDARTVNALNRAHAATDHATAATTQREVEPR